MPKIWQMERAEFIGEALIGPMYSLDGRDEEFDLVWECAEDPEQRTVWSSEDGRSVILDLNWDCGDAVALLADGSPVGFYYSGMCWVDPEHRGRGMGKELVLAATHILGESPVNRGEMLGFTDEGYNLHIAAHLLGVERALSAGEDVPQNVLESVGADVARPGM